MKIDKNGNYLVEEDELEHFNDALKEFQKEQQPDGEETAPSEPQKIEMTLYDMNKQVISQQPVMTRFDMNNQRSTFAKGLYDNPATYYMLLCHELNYYTLFHRNRETVDRFIDWVYLIMEELGDVKDISVDTNGAIALWANWEKNPDYLGCFYLFPYDKGVIETSEEPV